MTLYFLPSPEKLNYTSPAHLARSLVLSELTLVTHSIGHVIVRIEKKQGNKILDEVVTAVTTQDNHEERRLLLKEQIGFGILLQSLLGRRETANEIKKELKSRLQSGKIKFLELKINEDAFNRMKGYFLEYHKYEFEKKFGLTNRPRYGEGAGCSAYALSFLDIAGLILPDFTENWKRTLRIPKTLVGGWLTQSKVSFFKILFSFGNNDWAQPIDPHFLVSFWDPDLMFSWIHNLNKGANLNYSFENCQMEKAQGISIDCRSVSVPTESFWLFEKPVNTLKDCASLSR